MATGVSSWSTTAATNATADANVNWAEGQAPSTVNNSARAEMASVAKYRDDIEGSLGTGGTSTAFTVTTGQSFADLAALDGNQLAMKFHLTSGASPTLAVDGLAAKALQTAVGVTLVTSGITQSSIHRVTYDNGNNCFLLQGALRPTIALTDLPIGTSSSATSPSSNDAIIIYDTSSASSFQMILSDALKVVNTLSSVTSVQVTDEALIYDSSAAAAVKVSLGDIVKIIGELTVESLPTSADVFAVHDMSASTTDAVSFANAFRVINTLASVVAVQSTSEAVVYQPASTAAGKATVATLLTGLNALAENSVVDSVTDFFLYYDSSAGAAAKVQAQHIPVNTGMVLISTQSVTDVTSVIFTGLDATYDDYMIRMVGIRPVSAGAGLWMRVGTGPTPTWQADANDYFIGTDSSGNTFMEVSAFDAGDGLSNSATATGDYTVKFTQPTAAQFHVFEFKGAHVRAAATGGVIGRDSEGGYNAVESISAVSILMSLNSNTVGSVAAGRFTLYGLKK